MSAYDKLNQISNSIDVVPNHPKEGIIFRNISSLLLNHDLTICAIRYMARLVEKLNIDYIVGLESRGFLFAVPLADMLSQGFNNKKGTCMIRKPNKLPNTVSVTYSKEYGEDTLTIQQDLIPPGSNILLVDDLIATGGSFFAGCKLVEKIGSNVVGCLSLIQLTGFDLVEGLDSYKIFSLLQYSKDSHDKKVSLDYSTLFDDVIEYVPLNQASVDDDRIIVFCHQSMRSIANTLISNSNDFREGTIMWGSFPDGYYNVKFEDLMYLERKRVVFFGSMYDPKNIMEQLSMILVLPRQRIKSLDIFFPYFGPGTMERVETEGTLATAETFAQIISTSCQTSTMEGPPRVHIFDIHALPNRHYFSDNIIVCMQSAIPLLKERIDNDTTIVFPDDGAAKRFKADFENYTVIICAKDRIGDERHIRISDKLRWPTNKIIQLQKMKKCVIVDDLVQSGETLKKCSIAVRKYYKELLETTCTIGTDFSFNTQKVYAYATHAVFPNRAYEKFMSDNTFDKFFVTNSNPQIADFLDRKGPFQVIRLDNYIRQKLLTSFGISAYNLTEPVTYNVLVSSKSNAKLSAVYDALNIILSRKHNNYRLNVSGIGVCSNVPEQPLYPIETRGGCLNRLSNLEKYIKHNDLTYDLLVSIENGVSVCLGVSYDFCHVAIKSLNNKLNINTDHKSTIITRFPKKYFNESEKSNQTITVGKLIENELGLCPETWHENFDTKKSRREIIKSTIVEAIERSNLDDTDTHSEYTTPTTTRKRKNDDEDSNDFTDYNNVNKPLKLQKKKQTNQFKNVTPVNLDKTRFG